MIGRRNCITSRTSVMLTLLTGSLLVPAARAEAPADDQEALRIAARIDRHFMAYWQAHGIEPAPQSDDAEYLRRVYLDLGGVIPPVSEVRRFLADESDGKRDAVAATLLDGPRFVIHFSNVWTDAYLPNTQDFQVRRMADSLKRWLQLKLIRGVGYDEIVESLLTARIAPFDRRFLQGTASPSPSSFYFANQIEPAPVAAAVARNFLGIRIECAQCHDHPFDQWSRKQFWSQAAFFGGLRSTGPRFSREDTNVRAVTLPDSGELVPAVFLDGTKPEWEAGVSSRVALAEWITRDDNPYFAKAAVNRIWAQLLGAGFVNPIDDFSDNNPANHPELLELLAGEFTRNRYDLRLLVRAIVASQVYQLAGRPSASAQYDPAQYDPSHFDRMPARGLSADQLYDSIAQATGYFSSFDRQAQQPFRLRRTSLREEVLQLFGNRADMPAAQQTTILQALAMMNSDLVNAATRAEIQLTIYATADYPFANNAERISTLFLATLSREPSAEELQRFLAFLEADAQQRRLEARLGDVLWVLLNSAEFRTNH